MKKIAGILFTLFTVLPMWLLGCVKLVKPDKGSVVESSKVVVVSKETLGCGGYGAVLQSCIDPFDQNCFGAICDMGSAFFSYDKGKSWIRQDIQGTLYCLKFDPGAAGVVWAAGSGIYKSVDHGKTMQLVFPKPSEITSAGHNYENANYWIYTDKASDYAPQYQIHSLAFDRKSEGKRVYAAQRVPSAGMGYNKGIRIYRTLNGQDFSLFTEIEYSYNFKLDYDEVHDKLLLATPEKIYVINMDGKVEKTVEQNIVVQFQSANNIAFDSCYDAENNINTYVFCAPSDKEHIVSACYKTNDITRPETFVDITEQLTELTTDDFGVEDVQNYDKGRPSYEYCEWINGKTVPQRFDWTFWNATPYSDDVIYLFHEANTNTYDSDGALYIKRRTIIYLKYDARKPKDERFSWVFGNPLKPYNKYITNSTWVDADSDFCFGMSTFPGNENGLLYCSNVGLYYTPDGDKVVQLNSNIISRDDLQFTDGTNTAVKTLQRLDTTGVDVICTQTMVTDPFDPNHLLMGCTDIGLLQSYDNGKTWYRGLYEWKDGTLKDIKYATYTNTCFDIHFDKNNKNTVYGLWSLAKTAPYAPTVNYLTSEAHFGISYDGGLSWTMKNITPDAKCLPYKMQVVYTATGMDIYIATEGHGFFVSHDLGESFSEMNDGIEPVEIGGKKAIWGNDILVCDMGIFAITGGAASDTSANGGHMFYKWNDSAHRFESIGLPTTQPDENNMSYYPAAVRDLEYDAQNGRIYLACTANVINNGSKMVKAAGGVWAYKNGQFTQLYDDTVSVIAVNCDSAGRLYATEANGAIARFNDGNNTYEIIADGLFHMLKRVCFGATDDILYVPTWGGGTIKLTLGKA